jgi:hypothetical protein
MLLEHAFVRGANSPYIAWGEWNECDRRTSYLRLLEEVSADAANAWLYWAAEIAIENLSGETLRKVIVDFIGKLVIGGSLNAPRGIRI